MRLEGSVSYKDVEGTSYSEPFAVDLAAIEATAYRVTKDIEDVAKQLEEIARTLGHLATGFSKPLVRVITEKEHARQEEAFIEEAIKRPQEQSTLRPSVEQTLSEQPTP